MIDSLIRTLTKHARVAAIAVVLCMIGAYAYAIYTDAPQSVPDAGQTLIQKIKDTADRKERALAYTELIEHVGLLKAQDLLRDSGLPFNGESHLLNHTAGEYAYSTYGAEGITYCRDYFLQSCYHGFTIAYIVTEGIDRIGAVVDACTRKGPAVEAQCVHGIGHGLLAWVGYKNLPDAFAWCDTLGDQYPRFNKLQCYNGVAMENNWAVHDGGDSSKDRWVRDDDIYFPCDDPRIKDAWQVGCWQNQASVMFRHFKGDLKKTYEGCATVGNPEYREACYNNFARQLHPLAKSATTAADMCGIMRDPEEVHECIRTVATAEYSVGGRTMPFQLCALESGTDRDTCTERIFTMMEQLATSTEGALSACADIPFENARSGCAYFMLERR